MSFRLALLLVVGFAVPALFAAYAQPEPAHPDPIVLMPDQIHWGGRPGGNRSATLVGDQSKPDPFVGLLDWTSNNISKPHYHAHSRTFFVIKGHWDFGSGPHYNPDTMRAMPAGSAVTVPAGGILYDGCKKAPCLVEIIGTGQDPEFMVDENGKTLPPRAR